MRVTCATTLTQAARIAAEEEAARREAEEAAAAARAAEERQRAVEEAAAALALKLELRELNSRCERVPEAEIKSRDSSLKKYTAFNKKLRALSEESRASLMQEAGKLNLSKYIEEVAAAVAEAKLRMVDIPAAVQASSLSP